MTLRRAVVCASSLVLVSALAALALPLGVRANPQVVGAPLTASWEGLADAVALLSKGEDAGAEVGARQSLAALPVGPLAARAELALGSALRAQGRLAEAERTLGLAAAHLGDPDLAALSRFERGRALLALGRAAEALAEWSAVADSEVASLARRARWARAGALLQEGDAAGAAQLYEQLLTSDPRWEGAAAGRLELAEALRRSGDEAGAVATYRALWVELPDDPSGRSAGRALRAWRRAGGPVPLPSEDERLARAMRFLELSRPAGALAALEPLGRPPKPGRAGLLRALTLLQLGRNPEAAALGRRLLRDPDAALRAGGELVLARAAIRSGRREEAAQRYGRLALLRVQVPGLPASQSRDLAEESAFLAAWMPYETGDHARTVKQLGAYLRAHPHARRAEDARWFIAWSLFRLGRRPAARRAFAALEDGPLAPAALYWQGRLAPTVAGARPIYERVLREAPPGSWYAWLAEARLSRPPPASPAEIPGTPPAPPRAAPSMAERSEAGAAALNGLSGAASLLSAGRPRLTVAELRMLPVGPGASDRAEAVAQLAEGAGDAELPYRMARDRLGPSPRSLRRLHPLAYEEELFPAASRAGIDGALLLAIMRRESAFRPDVRSSAGAVGLVQIIPPTAERLATVHGLDAPGALDLEEPAASIPLAASYLALLGDRFREPAVQVAAYNAGPAAVARWAAEGAGKPLDQWVEDIPFRETRRYVKAVLGDAAIYRVLWGLGRPGLDGRRKIPAPRAGVSF